MNDGLRNVAASVRRRLTNRAKEKGIEFQRVLVLYGLERLLYRLSVSPFADRFILKGASLFSLWFDEPHRRTRDLDLLGKDDGVPHASLPSSRICVTWPWRMTASFFFQKRSRQSKFARKTSLALSG